MITSPLDPASSKERERSFRCPACRGSNVPPTITFIQRHLPRGLLWVVVGRVWRRTREADNRLDIQAQPVEGCADQAGAGKLNDAQTPYTCPCTDVRRICRRLSGREVQWERAPKSPPHDPVSRPSRSSGIHAPANDPINSTLPQCSSGMPFRTPTHHTPSNPTPRETILYRCNQ